MSKLPRRFEVLINEQSLRIRICRLRRENMILQHILHAAALEFTLEVKRQAYWQHRVDQERIKLEAFRALVAAQGLLPSNLKEGPW